MSIGAHEQFWINSGGQHMVAALHRAGERGGKTAALLVPPLLHEQHRSHRFLCEVASCLSEMGIPCLRFSFVGTGDSEGSGELVDLASMAADIEQAVHALQELNQCGSFVVIAFSSGALPLREWLGGGSLPIAAVLWDPVMDGAAWMLELERADERERRSLFGESASRGNPEDDDGQLMGYAVSQRLRTELAGLSWRGNASTREVPLWAVLRTGLDAHGLLRERTFALPADAPGFGDNIGMDGKPTLSPRLELVVQQVGLAALGEC